MDANNTWMGIGHLGADPVLRYTASGDAVCNFRIAIDRSYTQGNRVVEVTNWIPITAWRNDAEHYAKWLKKGSQVAVTGRLETRSWKDDQGMNHSSFEIVANDLKFLAGVRSKDEVAAQTQTAQV